MDDAVFYLSSLVEIIVVLHAQQTQEVQIQTERLSDDTHTQTHTHSEPRYTHTKLMT